MQRIQFWDGLALRGVFRVSHVFGVGKNELWDQTHHLSKLFFSHSWFSHVKNEYNSYLTGIQRTK